MDPRISTELARELQALARQQPGLKLSFIVTLAAGAMPGKDAPDWLPFKPTQTVETIRMVAGEMTAAQALALAAHAQVETVEYDGEMHALKALAQGAR